jgi:hypothetical protein
MASWYNSEDCLDVFFLDSPFSRIKKEAVLWLLGITQKTG